MAPQEGAHPSKFDPSSPCLVLAPHLEYPLRSGGDILIAEKWSRLSKYVPFVDIVGKTTVNRYEHGVLVDSSAYSNAPVSRNQAAFRTVVKRSHYLREKHLTHGFVDKALLHLAKPEYKTVVCSFIWTATLVGMAPEVPARIYCVETHNDEIAWFANLRKSYTNPLAKWTAYLSERWAWSFLDEHRADLLYFHVSKDDQQGYVDRFQGHKSIVVPIGVEEIFDQRNPPTSLDPPLKPRLLFVGALGVKINEDAIDFFCSDFYPMLKAELGEALEVLVVGSNPSDDISRRCTKLGWTLHGDVSDEQLQVLYSTATFSILPFRYTTGSKLKLLHSLANGVPYLATSALRDQAEEVIPPCLVSDDPQVWLKHVLHVSEQGITAQERTALVNQARTHSWESVADQTFQLLNRGGEV